MAAGKLDMDWSFASRSGNFSISEFDKANFPSTSPQNPSGLTFTGPMSSPGDLNKNYVANRFDGRIEGKNLPQNLGSISGTARGSFVDGPGPDGAARGVIGNWNIGGSNYKATGIFAGSGRPGAP